VADEIALCGTLAELILVTSIEGLPLNREATILRALQERYFRAVRNIEPHPFVELSVLSTKTSANQ
jgi:branched-chain amino acid aminotransferase